MSGAHPRMHRALMLSQASEATDYTDLLWNIYTDDAATDPGDPGILTWGPQGATARKGLVQRILHRVDVEHPDLLPIVFGSETAAVRDFAAHTDPDEVERIVRRVVQTPRRETIWTNGFIALGAMEQVRETYDGVMLAQRDHDDGSLPYRLSVYYQAWFERGWCPTEVDLAFFVDRSIQTAVSPDRVQDDVAAIAAVELRVGAQLQPAERRRVVAANDLVMPRYIRNRLKRDVIYYYDYYQSQGLPLTDASLMAMRADPNVTAPVELHGEADFKGVTATVYGLSDDRYPAAPAGVTVPAACSGKIASRP
jgi:hypothetical protein